MHWLRRIFGGQEKYPLDARKAVKWLKEAADQGDPQSQCSLGVHYINGEGVTKNLARGVYWYRAAAGKNDKWACYLLRLCYRDGLGVEGSTHWAKYCWEKALCMDVKKARKELIKLNEV